MKSIKEEVIMIITELSRDKNLNLKIKDRVTAHDKLNDLGFDSISFIKLVIEMENRFGIEFDDKMLDYTRYNTVAELIELVENKKNVQYHA